MSKGISVIAEKTGKMDKTVGRYVAKALFTTITNVNFDNVRLIAIIKEGLKLLKPTKRTVFV